MSTNVSNPYHYSLSLELALLEFFGYNSKWHGAAGGFENVSYVRKAILSATKKIRNRGTEIVTVDERLLTTINTTLDAIEGSTKVLSNKQDRLLDIVGHLLHLVAYLLGYDWVKGKPNREVVYFQTASQKWVDDLSQCPETIQSASRNKEDNKRFELVNALYEEKFRIPEIARIMRLSEPLVRDMLIHS
jgi:hypothetical protein